MQFRSWSAETEKPGASGLPKRGLVAFRRCTARLQSNAWGAALAQSVGFEPATSFDPGPHDPCGSRATHSALFERSSIRFTQVATSRMPIKIEHQVTRDDLHGRVSRRINPYFRPPLLDRGIP